MFQNRTGRMQQREKSVGNQSRGTSRLRPCRLTETERKRGGQEQEDSRKAVRVQSYETCHPSLDDFPSIPVQPLHSVQTSDLVIPCPPVRPQPSLATSRYSRCNLKYSPSALVVRYITARSPGITISIRSSSCTTTLIPSNLSFRPSPILQ